jgi:beta-mannanase
VNGNHTWDFVNAWRHIHNIFNKVGAHNVYWLWCPNIGHWASLYKLWPGYNYVDWSCLDGYNWGSTGPNSPGADRGGFVQFHKLYSAAYTTIARHIAPDKPMMLGEVASNNHGGSEAKWITRMFQELPTDFPKIQGIVWYQVQDQWDFPLRAHTAAARAFSSGIREGRYAANIFCRLSGLQPNQIVRTLAAHCKY